VSPTTEKRSAYNVPPLPVTVPETGTVPESGAVEPPASVVSQGGGGQLVGASSHLSVDVSHHHPP
jgi:hypothetical protein